jgi:KaiC/GvpD/RAD55 family RecA-like ATPase
MRPENNALNRTYFVAGPPRVGKTLLSYKLAEKIKGHVVSTDAIRSAAKKGHNRHFWGMDSFNSFGLQYNAGVQKNGMNHLLL